jgi:hypothetical protein
VIRGNWIADCANRSVQIYPNADGNTFEGNLIDSDHNIGYLLNNDSDNNVIQNNVVDTPNNDTLQVGSSWNGSGNTFSENCVWDSPPDSATGITQAGNIVRNPLISGHTVTDATCAAKLPPGSPFAG